MLIFEGVDFSGKSTLIKNLKNDVFFEDWQVFKYFKIKDKFPETWLQNIDLCAEIEYNCLVQLKQQKIILDRFFISSIIYNKVFDRKYDTLYINPNLFENDLIVYININDDVLLKRAKERSEDKKVLEKLLELNQEYKVFFESNSFNYLHIDGTVSPIENINIIKSVLSSEGFKDY